MNWMWQVKETEMPGMTPKLLAGAADGWRCHSLTREYSREKMIGWAGAVGRSERMRSRAQCLTC